MKEAIEIEKSVRDRMARIAELQSTDVPQYIKRKNRREKLVADTVRTDGWEVILEHAEEMIVALKEPISADELDPGTDLALIGALTISRSAAVNTLRELIRWAEGTAAAKEIERAEQEQEAQQAGVSE